MDSHLLKGMRSLLNSLQDIFTDNIKAGIRDLFLNEKKYLVNFSIFSFKGTVNVISNDLRANIATPDSEQ